MQPTPGKVYLVGAGPGDPGLVTVRAVHCLHQADVVVYDFLANPRLLEEAPAGAERICVGKQAGSHTLSQEAINELLVRLARQGKCVVRLKGGDPFVFGRGGEEALALVEAGLPFEVVPGVTAGVAAPAYAGIPVTHRGLAAQVTFVTGHEDPTKGSTDIDWPALARLPGTLVLYMGVGRLAEIADQLVRQGKPGTTPAAVIRWGTLPRQQVVLATLETIAAEAERHRLRPPAVIVVGAVADLRRRLAWVEHRPLWGQTIVVTRARAQASDLAARLEELGADVHLMPLIRLEDPADWRPLDEALARVETFDWAVFTSVNGVQQVLRRLWTLGRDIRDLKGVRLAAIGPATAAALEGYGLRVECVPETYQAEGMIDAFSRHGDLAGQRFLLARADIARPVLPDWLRRRGAEVLVVDAYRTVPETQVDPLLLEAMTEGRVQWVTLASSSTARHFVQLVGEHLPAIRQAVRFASIGPITSATARELGLEIAVEAESYTIAGLVDAIVQFHRKQQPV